MAGVKRDPLAAALASQPYGMVWCDRGMLPVVFGFCPNAVAWFLEMQRWDGCQDEPYPTSDGRVTPIGDETSGSFDCLIVTLHDRMDERNADGGVALMAHEAMHVVQLTMKDIKERKPSREFEAYLIQHIMLELLSAYRKTRGK